MLSTHLVRSVFISCTRYENIKNTFLKDHRNIFYPQYIAPNSYSTERAAAFGGALAWWLVCAIEPTALRRRCIFENKLALRGCVAIDL